MAPLQNYVGVVEWFTAEFTTFSKSSNTSFKCDKCNLINEDNECGYIATPVTEVTLDNDNICIVHDKSIQYIFRTLGIIIKQIKNGCIQCN